MRSAACLTLLCCACGVGPIPTARIDLEPATLCEGHTEQVVLMSATRSRAPNGTRDGLHYAWSLSSSPTETLRGADDEEDWVVRFNARHPVQIALVIEDSDGRIGAREKLLTLVRTQPTPCALGCAGHQICVDVAGEAQCVDDAMCSGDDECGCLSCRSDDSGQLRCLP